MGHQEGCPEVGLGAARMWATLRADASGRMAVTRAKRSRCCVVPRRRNWASATPNQAAGDAVQKSGSLKNLVGGCAAGGLPARSAAFSSTSMLSQLREKIRH